MSDQIDRITLALSACCSECAIDAEHIAYGIIEHAPAGLLVTPEHDAQVAARAWNEGHTAGVRNASAEFDGPAQDNPYKCEGGAS